MWLHIAEHTERDWHQTISYILFSVKKTPTFTWLRLLSTSISCTLLASDSQPWAGPWLLVGGHKGSRLPRASPSWFWASPRMEMSPLGNLFHSLATSTVKVSSFQEARICYVPTCICCLSSSSPSHPLLDYLEQHTKPVVSLSSPDGHSSVRPFRVQVWWNKSLPRLPQNYRNEEETTWRTITREESPRSDAWTNRTTKARFWWGMRHSGAVGQNCSCPGHYLSCTHLGQCCCSERSTRSHLLSIERDIHCSGWGESNPQSRCDSHSPSMVVLHLSLCWTTSRSHTLKSHLLRLCRD